MELAHYVCELSPEVLAVFLQRMSTQLQINAEQAKTAGKERTAKALEHASDALADAHEWVEKGL